MIFRDFVEQTKDALYALASQLEGERDLTPMLHFESEDGIASVVLDPGFFESAQSRRLFVHQFVIPLLHEHGARKVAWTFCAWSSPLHGVAPSIHPERRELLMATFIDAERHEIWRAPIVRTGGPDAPVLIGAWTAGPASESSGPLLTPIQEALR